MQRRIAVLSTLWLVGSHMPGHAHSAERSGQGSVSLFTRAEAKTEVPDVSITPSATSFPATIVDTLSDERTITLKNTGTGSLSISGIQIAGSSRTSFIEVSNCESTLAAGASCSIYAAFDPQKTGTLTGTLMVADNAANSPQSVALSGTGLVPPSVELTPDGLSFTAIPVGDSSADQTITLRNSSSAEVGIAAITLSGTDPHDFLAVNNCGAALATGASCSIFVAFTPTAGGTRIATVKVTDDASGSPQSVKLSGIGAPSAAADDWTWAGGPDVAGAKGVYGTRGEPAPANIPGARNFARTWRDAAGNFWLFGGNGYDSTGVAGKLNDLWKYDPALAEWTWLSGSNLANAEGVYGTKGVPAAGNTPGARNAAVSWLDASGNLWLFGGSAPNAYYNDLWKYTPRTNTWTWVGGPSTTDGDGVYGTKGVASPQNIPGARYLGVSWIDKGGNFWLFGGVNGGKNLLNDLWKYKPSNGSWTWVGGSDTPNASGVYGTRGVASSSNVPGSREAASAWTDSSGNFWLFGGSQYYYPGSPLDGFNDLWKYSPSENTWTWVSGADTMDAAPSYGTQGVASPHNHPGARNRAMSWVDAANQLWLFGGYSYDADGNLATINDLWKYEPSTESWTWMSGSKTMGAPGVYGSLGVPSSTTVPGARIAGATWTDSAGNLWLFGGDAHNYLSDLWEFAP